MCPLVGSSTAQATHHPTHLTYLLRLSGPQRILVCNFCKEHGTQSILASMFIFPEAM